jgi:hypothetical protein
MKLEEGEQGIAFFDFDETCVEPTHPMLSDRFVDLIYNLLPEKENSPLLPRFEQWFTHAIKERYLSAAPRKPCDAHVIEVIDELRDAGWRTKIVTNRIASKEHRHIFSRHLQGAGLAFDLEDCHLRKEDSKTTKGERILKLMRGLSDKVRVLFVDDDPLNCTHVFNAVKGKFPNSTVCQYMPRRFDMREVQQILVQLHAHSLGKPLPGAATQETLSLAMQGLQITEKAFPETFIAACERIATKDGF